MGLQKDDLAFPFEGGDNNGMQPYNGMTIREYFAAKAMSSLSLSGDSAEDIASESVKIADALIDELNK